jgi:hypothetical protein
VVIIVTTVGSWYQPAVMRFLEILKSGQNIVIFLILGKPHQSAARLDVAIFFHVNILAHTLAVSPMVMCHNSFHMKICAMH